MPHTQVALEADRTTLPIIDLSGLHDGSEEGRASVALALGEAARTSGFFYIKNHGVDQALIDGIFKASKAFHDQPRRYKMKYWSGFSTNHRGYVPFEENGIHFPKVINYNETFDLSYDAPADHPDFLAKWRMTGPNVWPDLEGFKETVSAYHDTVFNLGLKLLDALEFELGVEQGTLRAHVNTPTSQLRMLKYLENEVPATEDFVGIEAHSDFECFTILLQGGPGLQVMNVDDYWMEAPPVPGTFIVNIGDIFETWSGGQYKATQHRVVNTGRERYSFPLFFGLDYDTLVEPLPQFSTPETRAKYPPIKAGDHLVRMTVNTFRYMHDAHQKGEFSLDFDVPDENPFKREGKVIGEDQADGSAS
ncbi:MAG: 2-oxoglutarate and iron-dependent oxygenase domain-containing protein [Pseudomonadota bacterium]